MAIEHDLVVVTDEVYEHLPFDEPRARADRARCPGMLERTVTPLERRQDVLVHRLEGRLGDRARPSWCGAVLAAKQWLTFTTGAPLQPAVAHALDHEPDFCGALAADLQERARPALRRAGASSASTYGVPEGTYFVTTDIAALGLAGRHGVLPGAARAGRRGGDPGAGVLRRPDGRPATWCAGRSARRPT